MTTLLAQRVPQALEHIAVSVEKMDRLIDALLRLSRLGRTEIQWESLEMDTIVGKIIRTLAFHLQETGATVEVGPLPRCQGDAGQISQLFTNLLDNALKHTPGGGKVSVSARVMTGSSVARRGRSWPGAIEISVTDTGPGIPPEDLSRIFERFYQVDKSRARSSSGGSLGLGLAIAKEIVAAHGGSIHAESMTGLGAKFVVRLPIEPSVPLPHAP